MSQYRSEHTPDGLTVIYDPEGDPIATLSTEGDDKRHQDVVDTEASTLVQHLNSPMSGEYRVTYQGVHAFSEEDDDLEGDEDEEVETETVTLVAIEDPDETVIAYIDSSQAAEDLLTHLNRWQ